MRLLLGHGVEAHLLVSADCKEVTDKFGFGVINGGWGGTFDNGTITTLGKYGYDGEIVDTDVQILCSDQELLSGEYDEVINNYNNRMSANGLKSYEEFASVYTKRSTIVTINALVDFFDLYRPNLTPLKDFIEYLTELESEHPDKELLVNDNFSDEVVISYVKEETDKEFEARIRKSYNAYVTRQNQKQIKKAETREDKIKALEAELERLKQLENKQWQN